MFCTKCGAQVTNGAAQFCTSCGALFSASPAAGPAEPGAQAGGSAAPPSAQPVAPAGAKSSTVWIKVVIALVAFAALAFAAIIGTGVYIGYRVKNKVQEAKTEYGMDKIGSLSPSASSSPVAARDVCSLLSKEEVSEITGTTITEAHGTTSECTYASATNPTVVQDNVTWEKGAMAYKIQATAMRMSAGGDKPIVQLSGIGDEAMTIGLEGKVKEDFQGGGKNDPAAMMLKGMADMLGKVPLTFRKGDVMASVGVTEAPDLDEAKKALAKKIASRL